MAQPAGDPQVEPQVPPQSTPAPAAEPKPEPQAAPEPQAEPKPGEPPELQVEETPEVLRQRVSDTQAALHTATTRNAELEREVAEAKAGQAQPKPQEPPEPQPDPFLARKVARYTEQGYDETQARQYAQEDIAEMDARVDARVQARTAPMMGHVAEMTYSPAAEQAISATGAEGVTTADVAKYLRENTSPQLWAGANAETREQAAKEALLILKGQGALQAEAQARQRAGATPPGQQQPPFVNVPGPGGGPPVTSQVEGLTEAFKTMPGMTDETAREAAEAAAKIPQHEIDEEEYSE